VTAKQRHDLLIGIAIAIVDGEVDEAIVGLSGLRALDRFFHRHDIPAALLQMRQELIEKIRIEIEVAVRQFFPGPSGGAAMKGHQAATRAHEHIGSHADRANQRFGRRHASGGAG
jgi:hypothetical protein